jgi:hypothetical protein
MLMAKQKKRSKPRPQPQDDDERLERTALVCLHGILASSRPAPPPDAAAELAVQYADELLDEIDLMDEEEDEDEEDER